MNRNNRFDKILIPNTRLSLALNSYYFHGNLSQKNRLPENIRCSNEVGKFKSRLRSWILSYVEQFEKKKIYLI